MSHKEIIEEMPSVQLEVVLRGITCEMGDLEHNMGRRIQEWVNSNPEAYDELEKSTATGKNNPPK